LCDGTVQDVTVYYTITMPTCNVTSLQPMMPYNVSFHLRVFISR